MQQSSSCDPRDNAGQTASASVHALVEFLRFHGIPADASQIVHQWGTEPSSATVLRVLQRAGLKARAVRLPLARFTRAPMPALAVLADGTLRMLGRVSDDQVLLFDCITRRPAIEGISAFLDGWSGVAILATRRSVGTLVELHFGFRWFLGVVKKYRRVLGEVLTASLFLQIFALATPLAFQVLVDKVLVNRGMSTLDVVAAALAVIALFEALLGGLRSYVFTHTTNRVDVELGARLFHHLLALPLAYFQARRVGDSVARIRELENIRQFLTGSALTLVMDLLFTVVFVGAMTTYSLKLTAIVLLSIPIYVLVSVIATPVFRARLEERFRRGAENQAFLVEAVAGIETVKAMAVEPQMQQRWEEQLAGYVRTSHSVSNIGNVATQIIQGTSKLVTAATLWVGAHEVIDGGMTVGGLVAFNMLSGRVSQPVVRLAQMYQDFHQTRISVERLGDILNTPIERGSGASGNPPSLAGRVCFERVRFRHRLDGPLVLDEVSLDVAAGEIIGIVGPSGSGKSTLTKLLQRLYVPESGRILVDGLDLALADAAWLRRRIGVVLQENILFNMTVRENIALADPGMTMEHVVRAATLAGAHDFILGLPEGYDTQVGERGALLSGGQRQRIAIARALVGNPRILIFDEATSALDYESERVVQHNLRTICTGRTVFIVAHRLSTVRHADRIIALEGGRLVEQGSHDELLRRGGHYAALHALQGGLHAAG
ncbi:type I secretion system permease/ATPase [Nguyenibacter sp. L1]|uniref:type I secretion system permease/ATPase n=1 Tax=Nguyenibacter sp. L1 TaxID=3049350 RepID=UPI002B46D403|nr:type I secretion system permease/ATPase [Nguyenibacter sp. L1]WRH89634.1 type I secretion system permease/ATPase [Nguyenibacter sp. L1]